MRVRGDFSDSELEKALDLIRDRHPLLLARMWPGAPVASTRAERPRFPLRVLTGCGEADWIQRTAEELLAPFSDSVGPFARFTLLRGPDFSDILATFDHSVADGMAGVYVLRDILLVLGNSQGKRIWIFTIHFCGLKPCLMTKKALRATQKSAFSRLPRNEAGIYPAESSR
jgi:hypothetical protein